ncbi:hypothetical protein HMPREF9004_1298 [Schaalia cardiffensis F0333]|uniref:Uncharacterized protein n=1 Tax=Schaalia cardiffensis F0333 TaxID=888050 RepID=N6X2Q6_9ACTO|nr:hypothetical protein HMPREF9004_1298 [Schaalia cardiffensis F0333]
MYSFHGGGQTFVCPVLCGRRCPLLCGRRCPLGKISRIRRRFRGLDGCCR